MKKFMSVILSLAVMLASVLVAPRAAAYEEGVQTASTTDAYYVVIDSGSNVYTVSGYTSKTDSCASVTSTTYSSHYSDGLLHDYNHIISITTSVGMMDGLLPASNSYSKSNSSKETESTFRVSSPTYLYFITSLNTIHDFSCNGKSGTGTSSFSIWG